MGEHGLEGYAGGQRALVLQHVESIADENRNYLIIVRQLAVDRLDQLAPIGLRVEWNILTNQCCRIQLFFKLLGRFSDTRIKDRRRKGWKEMSQINSRGIKSAHFGSVVCKQQHEQEQ